jgi:hypothetical protein
MNQTPVRKCPPAQTQFETVELKGDYISSVVEVCQHLVKSADTHYNQLDHSKAYANYIECLDGYMNLLKITTDDPNFQSWLKKQLTYLMARAEDSKRKTATLLQDKKVAGYVTS